MKNSIFFKGTIREFDKNLNQKKREEIIFKVIRLNNMFFFAQEISTGSIFPIYNFANIDGTIYTENMSFNSYSLLESGKYYLYMPTYLEKETFEFRISDKPKHLENPNLPNIDEINKYLKEKNDNLSWKKEIKRKEKQNQYCIELDEIKKIIATALENNNIENPINIESKVEIIKYVPQLDTSEISEFGYDLSSKDELCNLIGREEEKKRITKAIAIGGDSILLIGPSGAGKTVIVESLALEIRNQTNPWLKNKTIFSINTSALTSDTKYRGEFEKKFQKLIDFCIKNKDRIVLFIDEIHTLYRLGSTEGGSIDVMNILKPYLDKGDITIIGATTKDEFQQYMANDPAFLRRLEKEEISVPTKQMNIEILLSYITHLERKYNVTFEASEEKKLQIVDFIIDITDVKNQRIVGDIKVENPTISKKLLKEAFTEAVYNRKETVTPEEICYAISVCDRLTPTLKEKSIIDIKSKLEYKTYQVEEQKSHLKLIRTL